jgi:beta-lactam-binding protein with PASTA domain
VPPGVSFGFAALRPGAYAVRVEAPGFVTQVLSVAVPSAAPLEFSLVTSGGFVPEIFGLSLRAALQELESRSMSVGRVLDVVGRDVPPANPGSEYNDQPVLSVFPPAGTAVPPEGQVSLLVSAPLQVQPSAEVPSLAGLTLSEAQKALEALGLVLGRVTTKA